MPSVPHYAVPGVVTNSRRNFVGADGSSTTTPGRGVSWSARSSSCRRRLRSSARTDGDGGEPAARAHAHGVRGICVDEAPDGHVVECIYTARRWPLAPQTISFPHVTLEACPCESLPGHTRTLPPTARLECVSGSKHVCFCRTDHYGAHALGAHSGHALGARRDSRHPLRAHPLPLPLLSLVFPRLFLLT